MVTTKMPGLTLKSLGRHPALIPLLVSIAGGSALAAAYIFRLATRNPDCCWDRTRNPYPWQKLGVNGQYKFYSSIDYKTLQKPEGRPDID